MKVFDQYAAYYDLMYRDKDYAGEATYANGLINEHFPNFHSILDLGCGTGLHAIAFASQGHVVRGVDLSERMLRIANSRAAKKDDEIRRSLSFRQGDVRTYRAGRSFDAATALFHVINYQNSDSDLAGLMGTAASHLQPGGVFLFDSWHGPAVLAQGAENRERCMQDERVRVERTATPDHRPEENRVVVQYDIRVTELKTDRVFRFEERHAMRYLFEPEVNRMLRNAGFKLQRVGEWGTGREPGTDTWNVYYVARKT